MLTPDQLLTLKNDIISQPTLDAWRTTGNDVALCLHYNALAVPDFFVWKTEVQFTDVMALPDFNFTLVDGLTPGKRDEFKWLFTNDTMDPSRPNIRAGIVDVWVGNAAKIAVQAAILAFCKRPATVLEKLLATGTGSEVDPATLSAKGSIGYAEMSLTR